MTIPSWDTRRRDLPWRAKRKRWEIAHSDGGGFQPRLVMHQRQSPGGRRRLLFRVWVAALIAIAIVLPTAASAADAPSGRGSRSTGTWAEPAPPNPWGYNFDGGALIYNPPSNFCDYFNCIASFWNGVGYVVQCTDSTFSLSGGRTGVCSTHGGFFRNLYAPGSSATPSPGPTPTPSPLPTISCGVERWSVKTGTDPDAGSVNTAALTPTTVAALDGQTKPGSLPDNARLAPTETTVYAVTATLTLYKREDDSDYHLVLNDASGNTMIVEIPHPACVGDGSPFKSAITSTRAKFDATYTATTSFKAANVPVTVTGVGFFDFIHGQTGVAPNGIELHPVLDISFNTAPPPAGGCVLTGAPTTTAYLPNITKTLGGPEGFVTPFIVQNVGTTSTDLQVSFYRFSNGSLVTCRKITGLGPGTSFADVPNNDGDLPPDSQFSVVVRSYGAPIVSVVNEHAGAGGRAEALSYNGFTSGSTTVFLPNIVKRFFGYHTPFIIQNLGATSTVATATFAGRGSEPTATVTRTIAAGQSQFIEPNVEPGLVDGGAYAVTVRADQPLAVVVNTHNDDPSTAHPLAYATDGIASGAASVYGPYAAKNANNSGRLGTMSTIVVQNLGTVAVTPTLEFTPLAGTSKTLFTGPSTPPGSAWAFDPRFVGGVGGAALCGTGASAGCLADGEYTFTASAPGAIAAAVNVISPDSAMGYTATGSPASKYFLPNVTRTLGGPAGWTTPVLLLSVTATGASVEWRRFSDGGLVTTQSLSLTPGSGVRINPLAVNGLADNTQYAVTVTATGGLVAAIVEELASGGDSAMIYEGFGQ